MYNPFVEIRDETERDEDIVARVLEGDAAALERLVYRHQAWIYNIALKMVLDRHDAEDVTQEILLKIVTHLSAYNPAKGSIRTWIYRIAANHVITMRTRGPETLVASARIKDAFTPAVDDLEDTRDSNRPDYRLLADEARELCLTGLLLCLDRRKRLAFILGEIFQAGARSGAEILGVSESNFRALLSRARKQLANFLEARCGLIDPANPCRCALQVGNMIRARWLPDGDAGSTASHRRKIADVVVVKTRERTKELSNALRLYRDTPFEENTELSGRILEIMGREDVRELFMLQ
ncbi:MAG: sigma-70 family RNA polymerase sigma factor [Spirochaetes bacterium]|nr:MAG: sigma-70 family RNA polymerase sigma factor [Spirochaetota bacterium]